MNEQCSNAEKNKDGVYTWPSEHWHVYVLQSEHVDENIVEWSKLCGTPYEPKVYKIGKCQCPVEVRISELSGCNPRNFQNKRGICSAYATATDWKLIHSKKYSDIVPVSNSREYDSQQLRKIEKQIQNEHQSRRIKEEEYNCIKKINKDIHCRKELFASFKPDQSQPNAIPDYLKLGLVTFESIVDLFEPSKKNPSTQLDLPGLLIKAASFQDFDEREL